MTQYKGICSNQSFKRFLIVICIIKNSDETVKSNKKMKYIILEKSRNMKNIYKWYQQNKSNKT